MQLGKGVTQKKIDKWHADIAPVLMTGERFDVVVKTAGVSPLHDYMIITDSRVWVSASPPQQGMPLYNMARGDILDATPLKNPRRVLLSITDDRSCNLPLMDAIDRPMVLAALGRPTPPVVNPPGPAPPHVPEHFVPYAADRQPELTYTFDATRPPQPGEFVPPDCVWSVIPYPGPLHRKATKAWIAVTRLRYLDAPGRPVHEIVRCLGDPDATSDNGDGTTILQWELFREVNSFHLSLLFDRYGVCERELHRWTQY